MDTAGIAAARPTETERDGLPGPLRQDYPACERWTFCNVSSRGILSQASKAAIDRVVDGQMLSTAEKSDWQAIQTRVRERLARLIGAQPGEIAITKNVSEGLNIIANALPWEAGDNLVLSGTLEHPNNLLAWRNLERRGVEVRSISDRDGAYDVAAMIAACDGRTRLLTVSSVTFTPGFRTDLAALGEHCRRNNIFFLVDGVQSVGVLQLDVEADKIDALSVSTSKGLLGLIGLGFLYCRNVWAERLQPAYLARFSVDDGGGHESELSAAGYSLAHGARRFEIGNYNWAALAAVDASLETLLDVGPARIERHVLGLAERLRQGLEALGLPVCRPPAGVAESHLVTVGAFNSGSAYATADPRLNKIATALEKESVKFTIRRGQLRFGFHLFNDESDVTRILAIASEALRRS